MYPAIKRAVVIPAILVVILTQAVRASEQAAPMPGSSGTDIRMLANEVDVLQLVTELNLTEKQITYIAGKISSLRQKREELLKREEAVLQSMSEALQKTRDALAEGKEVPSAVESITSSKLQELQQIRQQARQEFQSAVSSCVQLLTEGQVREIKRSPRAMSRANQIVHEIRSASEADWPKTFADITQELLEVKKLDRQAEWQAEAEQIQNLVGEERDRALADFEKRKESEIAEMRTETGQLLTSIRTADQRILSIAVNNVASALRPEANVQAQLFAMMSQILDNPAAEAALKARLENMRAASGEPAPTP